MSYHVWNTVFVVTVCVHVQRNHLHLNRFLTLMRAPMCRLKKQKTLLNAFPSKPKNTKQENQLKKKYIKCALLKLILFGKRTKEKEPNTKFTNFLLDHVPKTWEEQKENKVTIDGVRLCKWKLWCCDKYTFYREMQRCSLLQHRLKCDAFSCADCSQYIKRTPSEERLKLLWDLD